MSAGSSHQTCHSSVTHSPRHGRYPPKRTSLHGNAFVIIFRQERMPSSSANMFGKTPSGSKCLIVPSHPGMVPCDRHKISDAHGHYRNRFLPDSSESFLPNLIYNVYTVPLQALTPHRLGLFLMILSIGSCVDLGGGDESKQMGEQYYRLSRAALCELPLLDDTSIDAVQALVSSASFVLNTIPLRCYRTYGVPVVLHGMVSSDLFRGQESLRVCLERFCKSPKAL